MPQLDYGTQFDETGIDGKKPQSWDNYVMPFLQTVRTLTNTTKMDYLNIQDDGLRTTNLRTHANVEGVRIKARNATGSSIAAGSLIYFNGTYSDGSTNYPTIAKAISTTSVGSTFFAQAVTTAAIGNGADGTVAIFYEVSGVNTSSATVGDVVYLDTTAGGWTRTRPTGGQYVQVIGTITVVHASTGRIVLSLGSVPEHLTGGSSGLGATFQTITVTGEVDAGSLDISGDADIDGTLEADAITLGGTALGSLYSPIAGGSSIVTTGALDSGSITSGFGTINNGSSAITSTGTVSAGTLAVTSDITVYDDQNNADVSLSMGTGAAEALVVQALNGGSNKTLEELRFTTKTASGTGDHGKMSFYVDEAEIATIDDGGIDLASGKAFTVNGSALSSGISWDGSTANGVATYKDGDEATVESNLTFTGSALTCIGTVTVGVDDTGHDVKFFGATSGNYLEWDESADQLNVLGTAFINSGATRPIAEFTSSHTNRMVVISADTETANDTVGIAFNATASSAIGSTHSIAAIEGKVTQAGTLKGDLIFHTNAGDSYTEGMRLDSAQRLGVGCDDPSTYGAVNSTSDSIVIGNTSSGNGNLTIANTATGNGRIAFTNSANNTNQAHIRYDHNTGVMDFAVNGLGEVWRFANTGELTASHRSSMTDITYFNINTSTVETSNPKIVLASNSSTDNHLPNGEIRIHQEASVGSQYCVMTYTQSSSNTRKMVIQGDGDLENANNSYGSISDVKLKQDITDARSYWDDFKSLQFKKFRIKTDVEEDADAPYKFGLIAQEVEPIFPGIVKTRQDHETKTVPVLDDEGNPTHEAETDDDGNKIPITTEQTTMLDTTTKSIKYSVLSQIGLKVVQELQARLEAAEAKIAALEAA